MLLYIWSAAWLFCKVPFPLALKNHLFAAGTTLVVAAVSPTGRGVFRREIDPPSPTKFLLQCGCTGSVYSTSSAEISINILTVLTENENLARLSVFTLKKKEAI